MNRLLDALSEECRATSDVALSLPEADFSRPTRCSAWTVKDLLGHTWRDVDRISVYPAEPAPDVVDTGAVDYWGRYDPVDDAPEIANRAREVAAGFPTGHDLARSFADHWPECVAAARAESSDRPVRTWGPTMRLDDYLTSRILEVAVHGLDLADALGRRPWITEGGRAETRAILVGLLGGEPPGDLRWDDVAFIEKGTGRSPLTDEERRALGELAGLFPLLA